jgi:hypothetical protein
MRHDGESYGTGTILMSSERDRVRELAERVARKVADAPETSADGARAEGGDLVSLRSALSEIQRRLAHIESHLAHEDGCAHEEQGTQAQHRPRGTSEERRAASPPSRPTWLSGTYVPAVPHPSQERFNDVGEAVSELVEFFEKEKTCTIEPGGKPCDHCGQCSARGF